MGRERRLIYLQVVRDWVFYGALNPKQLLSRRDVFVYLFLRTISFHTFVVYLECWVLIVHDRVVSVV